MHRLRARSFSSGPPVGVSILQVIALFSHNLPLPNTQTRRPRRPPTNDSRCLPAFLLTCRQRARTVVAAGRQDVGSQLQSRGKFGAIARLRMRHGTCVLHWHLFQGPPESTTQKGTFMKCAIVLKVAAVAVVAGLAGCQDLKPLQADIADLKSQVAKLQSDVAAAKSSADQANSTAQSANQAASSAQSTANQALAAAQASQSAVDATNEKIDRMFKRSISK
jgi:outer membrane murein-binding lipoprotein Lpp